MLHLNQICVLYQTGGTSLLVALGSERVGGIGLDVSFVYCICHIALNFNKQFKNVDLKKWQASNHFMHQILTLLRVHHIYYSLFYLLPYDMR